MGLISPGAELLEWQTVARWLDSVRQPASVRFTLWQPLAVSIMNETAEAASASVFVRSLRTAFLGGWSHAAMAIPAVGLSELFAEPARRFIEAHGGIVRCGSSCIGLVGKNNRVEYARLDDGSTIPCRAAILALPPSKVCDTLPTELRKESFLNGIGNLPVSPIVSIHLWFTRQPMEHQMLGLPGRRVQWLFRKDSHLSAVISAAHEEVAWTNAQLVQQAESDVRGVYGDRLGELRHALVIRERRATFSSTPAVEARRPGTMTPWENLFLAGDWTATGYPATIEGAVMSGEAAALALLAR
jgi:squalene-associated FAD-dependent desaturase